MRRRRLVVFGAALVAALLAVLLAPAGTVSAAGPVVAKGETVRLALIEYGCTVGAVLPDPGRPARALALTAGHCDPQRAGRTGAYVADRPATLGILGQSPARLVLAQWSPSCPGISPLPALPETDPRCSVVDHAVISMAVSPGSARVDRIAAPPAVGSPVCKTGRITGRTCGVVVSVSSNEVVARIAAAPGDSGSGLVDSDGAVVGLLSRIRPIGPTAGPLNMAELWIEGLAGRALFVFTRADVAKKSIDAHLR